MAKALSRPKRWSAACNEASKALDELEAEDQRLVEEVGALWEEFREGVEKIISESSWETHKGALEDALEELRGLKEEYSEWLGNLPENLQQSPLGEKLQAIDDLDLEPSLEDLDVRLDNNEITSNVSPDIVASGMSLDEVRSVIDEAEGMDLPRGFGKD